MANPHPERFLELFAQEAALRLDRLSTGLLALESAPDQSTVVAAVLREMHTLKGEAAVVGLRGISSVAHALEAAMEPVRDGAPVGAELIDRVLAVLDRLREIIPGAVTGDEADVDSLIATLSAPPAAALAPDVLPAPASPTPAAAPAAVIDPGSPPPLPAVPPATSELIELPTERIDEIVRSVSESATAHLRLGHRIGERLGDDPDSLGEFRDLGRNIRDLHERAVRARMVPVSTVTTRLHRAARDVARASGKALTWVVEGEETELDRSVLQQLADPLLHMVRNAVDHGLETPEERVAAGKAERGTVVLRVEHDGSEVVISLRDDGRGIDLESLRREAARRGLRPDLTESELRELIFLGGFSTAASVSETSGRGVGLDVVRAKIEGLRGRVSVLPVSGGGTEFRIVVPSAASVLPCLILSVGGSRVAVPLAAVESTQAGSASTVVRTQGRNAVWVGDTVVPLAPMAAVLGLTAADGGQVVVMAHAGKRAALTVEAILGQRDVVAKGFGAFVPRLPAVVGAAVEGDGTVLMVLSPEALVGMTTTSGATDAPTAGETRSVAEEPAPVDAARPAELGRILVADDALAVRELERSILEQAGYAVVTAADGTEALAHLTAEPVDLVLTDVDMPGMNGFDLTRAIRQHPTLRRIPVLIVSANNTSADHRAGLEAGADGYIVKSAFGEGDLLATVERLLGNAA